nr:uncharacterized protein LOC109185271 [Ipomoea batatas]
MDSRGQANVDRNTPPPGIFTLKLRHGGRISQTLPAKYIGGSVSEFNDMVEDEWGLICLKEKVGEIGYTMDDSLSYFIGTEVGLQELVKDLDVWNLVNQSCSPKVIEIWIVKKGNGDDADECAGSAEEESDGSGDEWGNSGEESDDGSVEEYSSDGLLDVDVNDDADFEKNIDVNLRRRARSRGAARVQVPAQAAHIAEEPAVQVPVADAQNGDEAAVQVPAQAAQIGDEPAIQVQVAVEPDIISQPEIEDNLWEIPDDILDAHWHEIEVQPQNNLVEASLSTNSEIPVIQVPFEQEKRLKGKQGMVPKISRKRTASKDFNRQKQPVRKYGTRSSTTFKSKFSGNDKDPINLD